MIKEKERGREKREEVWLIYQKQQLDTKSTLVVSAFLFMGLQHTQVIWQFYLPDLSSTIPSISIFTNNRMKEEQQWTSELSLKEFQ